MTVTRSKKKTLSADQRHDVVMHAIGSLGPEAHEFMMELDAIVGERMAARVAEAEVMSFMAVLARIVKQLDPLAGDAS